MFPRDADVRGVLKRYPDVTSAERHALWSWYEQADAVELMATLNDPSLEPSLARLRRDHPAASQPGLMALAAVIVPLLLILAAATLL